MLKNLYCVAGTIVEASYEYRVNASSMTIFADEVTMIAAKVAYNMLSAENAFESVGLW